MRPREPKDVPLFSLTERVAAVAAMTMRFITTPSPWQPCPAHLIASDRFVAAPLPASAAARPQRYAWQSVGMESGGVEVSSSLRNFHRGYGQHVAVGEEEEGGSAQEMPGREAGAASMDARGGRRSTLAASARTPAPAATLRTPRHFPVHRPPPLSYTRVEEPAAPRDATSDAVMRLSASARAAEQQARRWEATVRQLNAPAAESLDAEFAEAMRTMALGDSCPPFRAPPPGSVGSCVRSFQASQRGSRSARISDNGTGLHAGWRRAPSEHRTSTRGHSVAGVPKRQAISGRPLTRDQQRRLARDPQPRARGVAVHVRTQDGALRPARVGSRSDGQPRRGVLPSAAAVTDGSESRSNAGDEQERAEQLLQRWHAAGAAPCQTAQHREAPLTRLRCRRLSRAAAAHAYCRAWLAIPLYGACV